MQKKSAGLAEIFRLYMFTRAVPKIVSALTELCDDIQPDLPARQSILDKFIVPFQSLQTKLTNYQRLVEHVLDFDKLPDYVISAQHDPELQELSDEQNEIITAANRLYADARADWASIADVKLEENPQHGYIFRSTKADDERALRANNSSIRIISILKACSQLLIVSHLFSSFN